MILSHAWNNVGCKLEEKGVNIPLWAHHYGFMYAMLMVLFYMACQSMYQDVMLPTHYLDPDRTEQFVVQTMIANDEYDAPHDAYQRWKNESTFDGFSFPLKEFSMLCPLWTLLTLLVCIWHTHQHINKIRANRDENSGTKGRLCDCPQHNQTLTVLILPAVYGLLSFKSTIRMWMVMINHIPVPGHQHATTVLQYQSYAERREFLLEMYEANFMVGDIYETIALVTFGNLVMGVLKKKIDRMKEFVKEATEGHGDQEQLKEYMEKMTKAMKTLTVAGVKLFAGSCMLQGGYTIIITTMAFEFPHTLTQYFSTSEENPGLFQTESVKESAHNFFLGAGFVASFAAIGNIMIIEEDFEELLEEFKPSFKFWGTKILVSLAFLQSILISVFITPDGWSLIQSNLLYSTCLGLECLLIAIFHLKGWSADEKWYGDYEAEPAQGQGLNEKLLRQASKQASVPMESK